MPEYDVSQYNIIVLLDDEYYEHPSKVTPLDVEGKVLSVNVRDGLGDRCFKDGKILELLCDYDYEGAVDAYIRWENDVKNWYTGGSLVLRRAKIGFCKSIWDSCSSNMKINTTPYAELCPRTHTPPIEDVMSLFGKPTKAYGGFITGTMGKAKATKGMLTTPAEAAPPVYGTPMHIPFDGNWHSCIHEGVFGRARRQAGADWIDYQEEAGRNGEQLLHRIPLHEVPPPQPMANPWTQMEAQQKYVISTDPGEGTVTYTIPDQHEINGALSIGTAEPDDTEPDDGEDLPY